MKVLVDLAMISAAGQGDMEVAKVSCLHVAATGYAALIYDLPRDAGFDKFFECCKEVWKNLQADESLPKKLCEHPGYLAQNTKEQKIPPSEKRAQFWIRIYSITTRKL